MNKVLLLVVAALALSAAPATADHEHGCYYDRWGDYVCCDHYSSSSSRYYSSSPYYSRSYSYRDPYYYDSYYDRGYRRSSGGNDLVNAAVGIGVANEVFNRGSSRDDIRKAAVGTALLGALTR